MLVASWGMAGKHRKLGPISILPHTDISQCFFLIYLLRLSYLLVRTLGLLPALCQYWRVPGTGIHLYGSCSQRSSSGRDQVPQSLSSSHLHHKAETCKISEGFLVEGHSLVLFRKMRGGPRSEHVLFSMLAQMLLCCFVV